jgi:hypothetical protein
VKLKTKQTLTIKQMKKKIDIKKIYDNIKIIYDNIKIIYDKLQFKN